MNSSISSTPTCGEHQSTACTKRTRKRRASTTVAEVAEEFLSSPSSKKRALGDITNLSSPDSVGSNFSIAEKPKPKSQSKVKNGNNHYEKASPEPLKFDAISDSGSDESERNHCAASSIYQYLRSLEAEEKNLLLPNYMESIQKDVTANMREILIDWLVEVAEEYKLVSDTLYLTVSYIDRYLSSHSIHRTKLQLLGVSCMLIASKYEEISPPHVEDFCYITDNTYTKDEVSEMEKDVLKFLDDELSTPTTKTFLRMFTATAQQSNKLDLDLELEFLGCYLAELSLLDYACARFRPSLVAASAIFLARFTLRPSQHPWNWALQQSSGYCPSELKECVTIMHRLQLGRRRASSALREKYVQHKFKKVASLISLSVIPECFFKIAAR